MASKKKAAAHRTPNAKPNPTEGFPNPFFRDEEHGFHGGELTVKSPVGSVFNMDYTRKDGSNVMEDVLREQHLDGHAGRMVVGKHKGGKH